jgi:hypothetical protein
MSDRPSKILLAVLLALGTIGVSTQQRPAPATGATARAVAAAQTFLATLDPAQRAKANVEFNEKTRIVWSNLPVGTTMQVGVTERNGLRLGEMTPAQEKAALALVATTLSREGYQKAMEVTDADEVLEVRSAPTRKPGAPIRFGRAFYYVSILGKPSATDRWMLQYGGHHLAINVIFNGGENVLTPTHTGAQPATYTVDGRTVRPLGDEMDKGVALINALTAEQQKQAILGVEVRNLVLGPGADGKMIAPEGVRASSFTPAQRTMLLELAREWVGILGDEAAAAKMKEIQSGIGDTYFAWAGPTTVGKGAYFRIQGPGVFIEYAPQGQGDANIDHIHTIYRDPTNDYADRTSKR